MVKTIPKSRNRRLEELRQALVVIESGLRWARETGDEAYFLPVVAPLRTLLASGKQTPLLLDLAGELGFPLEFYSMPLDILDNEEIAQVLGPTAIQWTGDSLSMEAEPPLIREKVTMRAWLASTQAVVERQKISGEQLLTRVANKLGATHSDKELPPELATMIPISIGGVPSIYRTLARLGEVVVHLGRALLDHAAKE